MRSITLVVILITITGYLWRQDAKAAQPLNESESIQITRLTEKARDAISSRQIVTPAGKVMLLAIPQPPAKILHTSHTVDAENPERVAIEFVYDTEEKYTLVFETNTGNFVETIYSAPKGDKF